MSINVFLSEKLQKNKDKIISTLSFYKNIHCLNNVLSIGTPMLNNKSLYEIWEVKDCVEHKNINGINISISKNYIFGYTIIENIESYDKLKSRISSEYFNIFNLVNQHKMKIVKIWHYLPQLLKKYSNQKTNYSVLCEARENVYKSYYKDFNYPTATVIGIEEDKVLIYFLASACKSYDAIENKRQISSYNYPQTIFSEKPMFSRAVKFTPSDFSEQKIVISGTASIKGYKSMHELEVIDQLNESIKNYKTFINTENNSSNISRVYLSKSQGNKIREIEELLNKKFLSKKYIILEGDICRKELLVEIEGISNV